MQSPKLSRARNLSSNRVIFFDDSCLSGCRINLIWQPWHVNITACRILNGANGVELLMRITFWGSGDVTTLNTQTGALCNRVIMNLLFSV
jgi:hypothetical protein